MQEKFTILLVLFYQFISFVNSSRNISLTTTSHYFNSSYPLYPLKKKYVSVLDGGNRRLNNNTDVEPKIIMIEPGKLNTFPDTDDNTYFRLKSTNKPYFLLAFNEKFSEGLLNVGNELPTTRYLNYRVNKFVVVNRTKDGIPENSNFTLKFRYSGLATIYYEELDVRIFRLDYSTILSNIVADKGEKVYFLQHFTDSYSDRIEYLSPFITKITSPTSAVVSSKLYSDSANLPNSTVFDNKTDITNVQILHWTNCKYIY